MGHASDAAWSSTGHGSRVRAGHAVVIGGGMAGLLAARVLATYIGQVTLVERDVLADGSTPRKGVPQSELLHTMLPRGRGIIDRLFPGYSEDLAAAGAVPLRVPFDALFLTSAGWLDRRASGWWLLSASRPLYEWTVRRRLRDLPNVTVLDRHCVTSLLTSRDRSRVTGVTVRATDHTGGQDQRLDADLVVDASGRASRTPMWLADAGYGTPPDTHVDAGAAYASRIFRIPAGFSADWKVVMLFSRPPWSSRIGYLFPIEDGQWMVTLIGLAGERPSTDEDDFMAFTRSLRDPVIASAIEAAEPLTPIRGYRATANRQWHYERMRRWPERFVVFGDAVCAFNPLYGQGMSAAAVAAEALDTCLWEQRRRRPAEGLDGLARRFQRRLARRNADPWITSTGEDLRFPTTTGVHVSAMTRLRHRYLDRVVAAATHDPVAANAYLHVLGMLARPTSLFAPRILASAARPRLPGVRRCPTSAGHSGMQADDGPGR